MAHNSRWRIALLLFLAVGFVTVGMWMVGAFGEVPASRRFSVHATKYVGWATILFFGLCAIAIARKLFDDRAQLQIGASGICSTPWSEYLIPWSEIIDVTTWSYKGQKHIVLHLENPDRFPGRGLKAALAGEPEANRGQHYYLAYWYQPQL